MKETIFKFLALGITFVVSACAHIGDHPTPTCSLHDLVETARSELIRNYPERSYLPRDGRFLIRERADDFYIMFQGNNPKTGYVEDSPAAFFSKAECRFVETLMWQ